MKRYLLAGAVGSAVFAAALGSAAALNVNGNPVAQYGEDMNVVCDPNGISADGFYVDSDGQSTSSGVVLSDIHADCFGKTIVATITDEDGDQLAKGAVENINSNTETVTWGKTVPMSSIYGVRLTIG